MLLEYFEHIDDAWENYKSALDLNFPEEEDAERFETFDEKKNEALEAYREFLKGEIEYIKTDFPCLCVWDRATKEEKQNIIGSGAGQNIQHIPNTSEKHDDDAK